MDPGWLRQRRHRSQRFNAKYATNPSARTRSTARIMIIGRLEDAALFGCGAEGTGAGTTGMGTVSGETGGTENMLSYGSAAVAGFGASVCAGGLGDSTGAGIRSATPNIRVNCPAC